MNFQPEKAFAYARELSYPRRVGSPGEAQAIDSLSRRLAAAGCEVERHPFDFSTGGEVVITLAIFVLQALILLTFWTWSFSTIAGVVPAGLLLALLALTGRLHRSAAFASLAVLPGQSPTLWQRLCWRLGRRCRSDNLVARPAWSASVGEVEPRPHLYLVAHSDSKSQALPLVARMLLIAVAGLAAGAFGTLSVLRPIWPGLTSAAAIVGLVALVTGVPVLFLFLAGAGNDSPGAIDNASGAGLVLHLAEVLTAAQPKLDLTFLITGAEELGVVGATAYVSSPAVAEGLRRLAGKGGLHLLNFDGVGGNGRLALVGGRSASRLAALVRACCVDLRQPLGRLPLVGALFDHIPFAEAGFDAVSLVTVGSAARSVHTAADSADKLDVEGFRQAGEVAMAVVEKLSRGKLVIGK